MEVPPERNYPKIITFLSSTGFQVVFTLLALGLTLFYNIAYYVYVPLTGVWLDYTDQKQDSAIIYSLDMGGPGEKAGLQVGDKIVTIDGRAIADLNIPVHQPKKPGEIELYVIERDLKTLSIPVLVGSYLNQPNFPADILPVQLLSLLFCLFGLILLFFSPPSDVRARLIAISWVLAGVALAATGPGYTGCIWFAPNVAMITFAVSIFIITSAHLYFPVATFSDRTRNFIIRTIFSLSIVLVIGYLSQQIIFAIRNLNPPTSLTVQAINVVFYFSLLVDIGMLLKNRFFVKDKDIRRQTSIIFLGTLIGFLPFLLFSELPYLLFGRSSTYILLPSNISILSMVFLPISYGYVIYQRKLLKIDFIINRALVLFLLVLLILFASFTVLSMVAVLFHLPARMAMAGSLLCVLVALPSASLKKKIQVQVDRALYGGYYDYTTVTSDLSNRLAQTVDRSTLITLLTQELPKTMKITQSKVLLLTDNSLEAQESDEQIFSVPLSDEICKILLSKQEPVLAQHIWANTSPDTVERWKPFYWVRLFIPIVHGETLYGVLLLGNRATGDIYSNLDLQILGTVGQQAALSIANIFLVERLRGLAQQMVRSDEEQRKKVARDLHDSVLQNLFFIKQRLARSDPEAASFADRTIVMLRQTIKTQRSSLLDRGLTLALQDLISHMAQLAEDNIAILWHNYLEGEIVLSDEKATSLYRIVQESLSNVLKHSQAEKAVVSARNDDGFLEIQIEDDGIGIASNSQAHVGHHYGLLGMQERASMIGASMSINSQPGLGTTVSVRVKL
jgi:two-component system sensor histidine kinase ComP